MTYSTEQGPVFSVLRLTLETGESIRAEAGAMIAMSASMQLQARTSGKGLFGTLGAMVAGEGFFASEYTAIADSSEILLAPSAPGDILHLNLKGGTIFAQGGAWLAGSTELELTTQGSLRSLISGEGLFLQKITGTGDLWLTSYGAILEKDLAVGEEYLVDTGNMVAFDSKVTYTVNTAARGLLSSFASGEGLVCRFRGPGRLWIQTRNLRDLAKKMLPFLPKAGS